MKETKIILEKISNRGQLFGYTVAQLKDTLKTLGAITASKYRTKEALVDALWSYLENATKLIKEPSAVTIPIYAWGKAYELNATGLTGNEQDAMVAIVKNEFCNGLEEYSAPWVFAVAENAGISDRSFRGVLASLIKKGLVEVAEGDETENVVGLTEKGKALYTEVSNKTGYSADETKAKPKKSAKAKKAPKQVKGTLRAFTGMLLGEVEGVLDTKTNQIKVTLKSGTITFNLDGVQIDAKNPRFGNKLVISEG